MKVSLIILLLLVTGLQLSAQTPYITGPEKTAEPAPNVNDTAYTRIFNGILISSHYLINDFSRIKYIRNKEDIQRLGIITDKPVMLVEIETISLKFKIDSVLYSRPDFISGYKFPLSIQLPVSINGNLLGYRAMIDLLPGLTLDGIRNINYVDSKASMSKYGTTPFGVIDLVLE